MDNNDDRHPMENELPLLLKMTSPRTPHLTNSSWIKRRRLPYHERTPPKTRQPHRPQRTNECSADVQDLLDSHNQKLAIHELIEEQEQNIEELESLDPVQSEDRMTVGNWTEGLIAFVLAALAVTAYASLHEVSIRISLSKIYKLKLMLL
ncbi:hypothetical protein TNCV_4077581 [Trichonephila clavipes]|nr:hypothetical protein TNCV_4077581 [Trichonephila clavipes]